MICVGVLLKTFTCSTHLKIRTDVRRVLIILFHTNNSHKIQTSVTWCSLWVFYDCSQILDSGTERVRHITTNNFMTGMNIADRCTSQMSELKPCDDGRHVSRCGTCHLDLIPLALMIAYKLRAYWKSVIAPKTIILIICLTPTAICCRRKCGWIEMKSEYIFCEKIKCR